MGRDLVEVYISADFKDSVSEVLHNALRGQVRVVSVWGLGFGVFRV